MFHRIEYKLQRRGLEKEALELITNSRGTAIVFPFVGLLFFPLLFLRLFRSPGKVGKRSETNGKRQDLGNPR